MNLLLHLCCAPCTLYPESVLRPQGMAVTGFFFNPNIHPYTEYRRRLDAVTAMASNLDLDLVIRDEYGLDEFLRAVAGREDERCEICYRIRLTKAAEAARTRGAGAYSTTLLYSVYQKHELVRRIGTEVGEAAGVPFYYEDFRPGWREGVARSRAMGLYRQSYCGCIYSERDRYLKKKPSRQVE